MKFYTQPHKYYCGIDLHARMLYVCILDQEGNLLVHKNIKANPEALLKLITPYRDDLVIGVECMFSWYWLADLCGEKGIAFILGHALYMRAIHGGKAKNDQIDANKIAGLLRGGMFPMRTSIRATCVARVTFCGGACFFVNRSELIAHVVNTNSQYNLPEFAKNLSYAAIGPESPNVSPTSSQMSIELDLNLIDFYDKQLNKVERHILKHAKINDQHADSPAHRTRHR